MVAGPRPELLAALLIAVAVPGAAQAGDWRQLATQGDRARLREWRTAWMAALGGTVPRDPLFDPDQSLTGAMPPAGAYRCRRVPLGGNPRSWTQCRLDPDAGQARRLTMEDAGQRPEGVIYPNTDARAVFLGTWRMTDERRAIAYGRDTRRDQPGWVERVGAARWRLALPYPAFGGVMELVELVPDEGVPG